MVELMNVYQLRKQFGKKEVLKRISFQLYEKEVLCILGPNGAGKSTIINILSGVLAKDEGEIKVDGIATKKIEHKYKGMLGIVPQDISLYEDLTALQNICFFASLYGLRGAELKKKVQRALYFVGLEAHEKQKVKTFSGGMKRRLNIACAIAHEPRILIMDEPTVGIDPQSRNHILDTIIELRKKGMSVIYTTHYMEEVESIASRIIILDKGEIIATGTKEDLKMSIQNEQTISIEVHESEQIDEEILYRIEGVKHVSIHDSVLTLITLPNIENLDRIIETLMNQGVSIHSLRCETPTLETVFLKLTGKKLRD